MGSNGESGNGAVLSDPEYDPHVRGPLPIITVLLINTSPLTSTGLTAKTANSEAPSSPTEELRLSIHFHLDGVAMMRIVEVLDGNGDSLVRSTPRWMAEELVLNEKEMEGMDSYDVQVLSLHPAIVTSAGEDEGKEGEKEAAAREIYSLVARTGLAAAAHAGARAPSAAVEKFVAFAYGG